MLAGRRQKKNKVQLDRPIAVLGFGRLAYKIQNGQLVYPVFTNLYNPHEATSSTEHARGT